MNIGGANQLGVWHVTMLHAQCLPEITISPGTAAPHGAGWYVFAIEDGSPRQLKAAEDEIVNEFRFRH